MKKNIVNKYRYRTLFFLKAFNDVPLVHLTTDINMERIIKYKEKTQNGYLSLIIYLASVVLKGYPQTRSYVKQGIFSEKVIPLSGGSFKYTVDKSVENRRFVRTKIISDEYINSIEDIQRQVTLSKIDNTYKNNVILDKFPFWLGYLLFKLAINNKKKREKLLGTYSITSIGKFNVKGIFPISSSSISFGVGHINNHKMMMVLSFDHRIIDGAMAAEIFQKIKWQLEHFEGEYNG